LKDAVHLFKEGLVKELTEAIEISQTTKSTMKFASTGRFMDEEDLKEKYKNKPDQLEQIFDNARTMTHPDRKVTMWEDRDFTLDLANEEERASQKKRLRHQRLLRKSRPSQQQQQLGPPRPPTTRPSQRDRKPRSKRSLKK